MGCKARSKLLAKICLPKKVDKRKPEISCSKLENKDFLNYSYILEKNILNMTKTRKQNIFLNSSKLEKKLLKYGWKLEK